MYDFVQISILGIVLAVFIVFIRNIRPEYTIVVSVAGIGIILLSIMSELGGLLNSMKRFLSIYNIDGNYIEIILKVCGISFVCSFAAETCRDSGCAAVAATVETTGRIFVVATAMPLAVTLTETVIDIINSNAF